jgi:hypothetical protein
MIYPKAAPFRLDPLSYESLRQQILSGRLEVPILRRDVQP